MQRMRMPLNNMPGSVNKSLAKWFDNMDWLQQTFKLETNSELNILEEPKKR